MKVEKLTLLMWLVSLGTVGEYKVVIVKICLDYTHTAV